MGAPDARPARGQGAADDGPRTTICSSGPRSCRRSISTAEPTPSSVRWVDNQQHRWGSCTPDERHDQDLHPPQGMPAWVVDYVIIHELVHLLVPSHGPRFWALVEHYPKAERARGFLEGFSVGGQTARGGMLTEAIGRGSRTA